MSSGGDYYGDGGAAGGAGCAAGGGTGDAAGGAAGGARCDVCLIKFSSYTLNMIRVGNTHYCSYECYMTSIKEAARRARSFFTETSGVCEYCEDKHCLTSSFESWSMFYNYSKVLRDNTKVGVKFSDTFYCSSCWERFNSKAGFLSTLHIHIEYNRRPEYRDRVVQRRIERRIAKKKAKQLAKERAAGSAGSAGSAGGAGGAGGAGSDTLCNCCGKSCDDFETHVCA